MKILESSWISNVAVRKSEFFWEIEGIFASAEFLAYVGVWGGLCINMLCVWFDLLRVSQ